MAGSLATFAIAAEQFLLVPVLPTVFISRDDFMRHPRRLSNLSNRVCHNCCSGVGRTLNPQSEPAVIVRHRIRKPRRDYSTPDSEFYGFGFRVARNP